MRFHRLRIPGLLLTALLAASPAWAVRVGAYVSGAANQLAHTSISQTSASAPVIDDFTWTKYGGGFSFDDFGETLDKVIMGVRIGYEMMDATVDMETGEELDLTFNGFAMQGSGKVFWGDRNAMSYGIGPEMTLGYYIASDPDLGDPDALHLGLGLVGSVFFPFTDKSSCNLDLGGRWAYYKMDGSEVDSVVLRAWEVFVSLNVGWNVDWF